MKETGERWAKGKRLSVEQKALARMGRTSKKGRWYARGGEEGGRRNAKKGRENKKHRADRALNRAI